MNPAQVVSVILLSMLCSCATFHPLQDAREDAARDAQRAEVDRQADRRRNDYERWQDAVAQQQETVRQEAIANVFFSKTEPPNTCKWLGPVQYYGYSAYDYETSLEGMKEEVADKGGNYLVLDGLSFGRAYSCPKG
jgi:hypothetical protein